MTEQEELEQLLAYIQTDEFRLLAADLERRQAAGEVFSRAEMIRELHLPLWFGELYLDEIEYRQSIRPKTSEARN